MSAKFTPGPWAYSTSDEGWTFSIYQADDAGFTPESSDVATLFAHTVQCDPKDIQEANARLIAAAPMLLEEFQNANVQMDMAAECIEAGRYDEALLHVRAMKRKRTAIIAAATGETE